MESIHFLPVKKAPVFGVPNHQPTYSSESKAEPQASAAPDTQETASQGLEALALNPATGLKLPNDPRKRKNPLSKLEEMPHEILAHIIQIALNVGVELGVLAVLSKMIFLAVENIITSRLDGILAQAEKPSSPISVRQWLEANKWSLRLVHICKVKDTAKFKKDLNSTRRDGESLLNRLHTIGLDAMKSSAATWCKAEKTFGNLNLEKQANNFVDVYKNDSVDFNANGERWHTIPEQIGFLQSLQHLDLTGNNLSDIPETLYELKNLTMLDLSCNRFSALPSGIKLLNNLKELNLSYNNFDELPNEIGDLSNLRWYNASHNNIRHFSAAAGQFRKLTRLFLMVNLPLETLSEELATLPHLIKIRVHGAVNLKIPLAIQDNINIKIER